MLASGLYIVATPIGNLGDFSQRAQDILTQCTRVLCEDTRETRKLLNHYGIKNTLVSYHKFNEHARSESILALLQEGCAVALVSDSGTPAISDPGTKLVEACHQHHISVYTVPGCCAVTAAVSASGLAENGFTFIGFLPSKRSARVSLLQQFQHQPLALVCFESPHRIIASIDDVLSVFGEQRRICLARELTKKFETIRLDTLANLCPWLHNNAVQQKGEMVLVIEGNHELVQTEQRELHALASALADASIGSRQASQVMAALTGLPKRECYQCYLEIVAKRPPLGSTTS